MWPNPQFPADLVTFTEEILNGKLHFLCSGKYDNCFRIKKALRALLFFLSWANPYILLNSNIWLTLHVLIFFTLCEKCLNAEFFLVCIWTLFTQCYSNPWRRLFLACSHFAWFQVLQYFHKKTHFKKYCIF